MLIAIGAVANEPVDVNEKVLKAFKETFSKATDVIWSEVKNTYYARFRQSDIVTRASFDPEGNLLLTIRYYEQDNLPMHILAAVKKKYNGRAIFGVTETTVGNEVHYYITLQDNKNWYFVKSDNWAQMEVYKKFKKA
jgi:hypothetical protein